MTYLGHDNNLTSIYINGDIYALCRHVTADKKLNVIVDLGAHFGAGYESFGILFPNSKYVMVEPVEKCIQQIQQVILKHQDKNIMLIDGILGNESGTTEINTFQKGNCQSSNLFSTRNGVYGSTKSETIKVYSYDAAPMKIDFAKINIEGGEYELINDGFFDRIDTFVMEVHNNLIQNKNYLDIINGPLSNDFNLVTCGRTDYKYCFCIGYRI